MFSSNLIDVLVLLVGAVVVVPIFQWARLGAVPGFLVAGLIVGPSGFGWIGNVGEISHFAEFGVVLLLFIIGIELKVPQLWKMRSLVFGLGTFQVLITGAAITGLALYVFDLPVKASLLIGPALALSSTAFVLQILAQQGLLNAPHGRVSLAILLLQDLAVVPLLALVPLLVMPELGAGENVGVALIRSVVILGVVALVGRYLMGPVLQRVAQSGNSELFTGTAVLIVLGTALAAETAGLSMAMGAFLAGLLISDSSYRHQILAEIMPFRGLLLGLFFMSMGMSVNLSILLDYPLVFLFITAGLLLLKAAILFPLARLFRIQTNASIAVALMLAQSGEFAMVLFALARKEELLTEVLFQQLLLIIFLTMLVTPALAELARRVAANEPVHLEDPGKPPESSIVLAGFGRVGRRIGEILTRAGVPFVALESDPRTVKAERANGYPVYNGNVCQPGLFKTVGAKGAEVIIVTLNTPEGSKEVVSSLRELYPDISIFARGHDLQVCRDLKRLGASGVVSENFESSIELAALTLSQIGIEDAERDDVLTNFRKEYEAEILR